MKKVLSLVLVIAMVLSSMSFAFAGTFEDVKGDYEDAVNALVALGVVKGYEDGTFRPERIITRAELAKILVEAMGYGKLVPGATNSFSDTQGHWASGYVTVASGTGLVVGYPDGTFKPDKTVTFDEAYTMVLRAVGYVDSALKGTWPTNFKVKAIDLGLDDDVVMAKADADRGGVAQILYNALELPMVELGEDNVLVKVSPEKLFIDNIATPKTITVSKNTLDSKHKEYAGDVVDLSEYMYESINVYLNDDDEVVYVKDSNSTVYEGVVEEDGVYADTKDADDVIVEVKDADGKVEKVKFDEVGSVNTVITAPIYENGKTKVDEDKTFEDLEATDTIKIVYTDPTYSATNAYDSDEEVLAGFVVTEQTNAAKVANEYIKGKDYVDEFDLPVDEDGDVDFSKVNVVGAVDTVEDISEDDVVVEYAAYNADDEIILTKLVVSRETVEGKITRVDDGDYYINGTAYTANAVAAPSLAIANSGTFFLDHNGEIVAFEGNTNEPTDYAMVLDVANGKTQIDRYGKETIKELPQLKLATQEGEEVYLDIYVDVDFNTTAPDVIEEGPAFVSLVANGDVYNLVVDTNEINDDFLIKYSLNKDGKIEEVEVVATATELAVTGEVNLDKKSDRLASDVVVFNSAAEDYEIVDVDKLPTTFDAFEHRNTNGLIDVLVLADDQLGSEVLTFAYITKVNQARDNDNKAIAYVEAYINDDELGYFTTTDLDHNDFVVDSVYAVTFDGELIDSADLTTASAVTASDINYKENLIKIGGTWYSLADNATVVIINSDNTTELGDLVDIEIGNNATSFTYFEADATDDVIGLIVIDLGAQN